MENSLLEIEMSDITNIMILGPCNDEFEAAVPKCFEVFGKFVDVGPKRAHGWRVEGAVFIGAFNRMDRKLFCICLSTLKEVIEPYDWESTQVMIMNQDDSTWAMYRAEDVHVSDFN